MPRSTAEALRSARRLEDFNRQFAFVVHDVKNVVGQMSLMLENAKKVRRQPGIPEGMLETVGNSVGRMRALLDQLASQRRQPPKPQRLELKAILGRSPNIGARPPPFDPRPAARPGATPSPSKHPDHRSEPADRQRVIGRRADRNRGAAIARRGERATIEVSDNGPGMDETFVNKELFRPLASTKSSGYGIGAYQTRHLVREMGAQLEVDSAPQRGTTMRIVMKVAAHLPWPSMETRL